VFNIFDFFAKSVVVHSVKHPYIWSLILY